MLESCGSSQQNEDAASDHCHATVQVTWRSSDGQVLLYDNGRLVWNVVRGRGATIPSGGTLVIGREQDCVGGCFDSNLGMTCRGCLYHCEYNVAHFRCGLHHMRPDASSRF